MSRRPPVDAFYTDAFGERRRVPPEVRKAVAATMRSRRARATPSIDPVRIARRGERLPPAAQLVLEDGTDLGRVDRVPPGTPYGYHRLVRRRGEQLLVVGPGRCHLPESLREWGFAVQLASLWSPRSWGIGDFGDLRELAGWSAEAGAGFLAVGPLGAPNPGPKPEESPYWAATRRFLNPLHLRVEEVPGAEGLDRLIAAGRALSEGRLVDRRAVQRIKLRALERIWASGRIDRAGLEAFRTERGPALERWAAFVVLSERHGAGWRSWPRRYRRSDGAAVAAVAARAADRIGFHCWIQMLLDRQLAEASHALRRIADMPVGLAPSGFDAWDWQDQFALDASVGAPPDRFNAGGQNWGLAPFIPDRLREARYLPFVETLRAQLRHAAGLRIDHVMGLFRLWWIPTRHGSPGGAYVRYPANELLEIVALESERAGAVVIGEDLGTVPPGVRTELRRRRILSTRLVLFERVTPDRYPHQTFAAVTTHDLPTIAGIWGGADLRAQARAGINPDRRGAAQLRRRVAQAARTSESADLDVVVERVHRRLARAPSMLVAATLEDALRVAERPNVPGTVSTQRPNWSVRLPLSVDGMRRSPRLRRLAELMRRGRLPLAGRHQDQAR